MERMDFSRGNGRIVLLIKIDDVFLVVSKQLLLRSSRALHATKTMENIPSLRVSGRRLTKIDDAFLVVMQLGNAQRATKSVRKMDLPTFNGVKVLKLDDALLVKRRTPPMEKMDP